MAFDFPASPTTGQTYQVSGGPTYVYNGTAWQVLTPGSRFNRTTFTATAGQTTFSVNYLIGGVDVFRNGVKLVNVTDFTATNGTSVVLADGCTAGDTVEIVSYAQVNYTNAMQRTGDTMTGDLIFSGTGRRIKGDTVNATVSNRLMLQDSGTNQPSAFGVIPNGTATSSFVQLFNSSTPDNSSILTLVSGPTRVGFTSTGIGTGSALPMIFSTAGTDRMTIDTSGNVLVGVSTASATGLNVAAGYNISFAEGSANTTYTNFFRQASSGAAVIGYGIKYSATANGFASSVGSSFARSAIVADYGSIKFYTDGVSTVASGTDITPTERARFDSNGFFFVGMTGTGTTPTNGGAYIKGDVYSTANDYATLFVPHNSGVAHGIVLKETAATTGQQIRFYHGASLVGSVTTTSSATSYNTTSDYRLKENVQPMQNALAKVALLNPVTYTWKENGSDGQGFIAHELQAVCPDAVTGEKDAVRTVDVFDDDGKKIGTKEEPVYQGVDTSFLVATLTKAIQELKTELDAAKARIAALEGAA